MQETRCTRILTSISKCPFAGFLYPTNKNNQRYKVLPKLRSSSDEKRLYFPSPKHKGRDTLGDKSQRQVSATSCSMCTTCKTSRCDTTPVRCTRSDLVWRGTWTSFLIQYGWPYDALSLVHLYSLAATCCRRDVYTRCDNAAFAYFVAAISRTNSNWCECVRLVEATKFCPSDNDFS